MKIPQTGFNVKVAEQLYSNAYGLYYEQKTDEAGNKQRRP